MFAAITRLVHNTDRTRSRAHVVVRVAATLKSEYAKIFSAAAATYVKSTLKSRGNTRRLIAQLELSNDLTTVATEKRCEQKPPGNKGRVSHFAERAVSDARIVAAKPNGKLFLNWMVSEGEQQANSAISLSPKLTLTGKWSMSDNRVALAADVASAPEGRDSRIVHQLCRAPQSSFR